MTRRWRVGFVLVPWVVVPSKPVFLYSFFGAEILREEDVGCCFGCFFFVCRRHREREGGLGTLLVLVGRLFVCSHFRRYADCLDECLFGDIQWTAFRDGLTGVIFVFFGI